MTSTTGKTSHLQASWFISGQADRGQVHATLRREQNGAFRVFTASGLLVIAYLFDGTVFEESISLEDDKARFIRESLSFFSLSALVAFHYYETGILRCLLSQTMIHSMIRSVHLTASGQPLVIARTRVDAAAAASSYYLGGVPEEVAVDALDGAFDGAFVVRDSLSDMHMLWLHYIEQGRVHQLRIHNTPKGLHLHSSVHTFDTLSQLIVAYINDPDNDMRLALKLGWGVLVTVAPPPVGLHDHLTAPWYFEDLSLEDANKQLEAHISGAFVCRILVLLQAYWILLLQILLFVTVLNTSLPFRLCEVGFPSRGCITWIMCLTGRSCTRALSLSPKESSCRGPS